MTLLIVKLLNWTYFELGNLLRCSEVSVVSPKSILPYSGEIISGKGDLAYYRYIDIKLHLAYRTLKTEPAWTPNTYRSSGLNRWRRAQNAKPSLHDAFKSRTSTSLYPSVCCLHHSKSACFPFRLLVLETVCFVDITQDHSSKFTAYQYLLTATHAYNFEHGSRS